MCEAVEGLLSPLFYPLLSLGLLFTLYLVFDYPPLLSGKFSTLINSILLLFGKFSLSTGGMVRFKTLRVESAWWFKVEERSISIIAGYIRVEGLNGAS